MAERKVSGYLSKSLFMAGHQCHKRLWLRKHQPDLSEEADASLQARFRSGHEIGKLAQQLFPGGVEVPYEGMTHPEQLAMTQDLLDQGKETIYEATFEHDGVFVKVDILHRGDAGWEILEVKGAAEVKEHYYFDAAIQLYVLAGAGLKIAKVAIVHVDNRYTRRGDIDVQKLFKIVDITADVRKMQTDIGSEIAEMRAMLQEKMPTIDIGSHCSDPYDCDFHKHCWQHIPEDSVFTVGRLTVSKRFDLYRQGMVRQSDIPANLLSEKQRHQVESTIKQCNTLKTKEVRRFLDALRYPICYLDFETVNPAIPLFDESRPYKMIPFQYSLHVQPSEGAALVHHEFLAQPGIDPREELTATLLGQIPEGASVIAWYESFEKTRLRELAKHLPPYATRIGRLLESFHDPIKLFQARSVYFWQQKGSSSIKDVLPLLVPELSYDEMDVANGGMAMTAYYEMCATQDPQEVARIRNALLDYCGLDTLAMVRIVEKLREMVQ